MPEPKDPATDADRQRLMTDEESGQDPERILAAILERELSPTRDSLERDLSRRPAGWSRR